MKYCCRNATIRRTKLAELTLRHDGDAEPPGAIVRGLICQRRPLTRHAAPPQVLCADIDPACVDARREKPRRTNRVSRQGRQEGRPRGRPFLLAEIRPLQRLSPPREPKFLGGHPGAFHP